MSAPAPEPLTPRRAAGRAFSGRRKVRLGDADPTGRLRLDALTRYTQDVSDDDTTDAGLDTEPGWVVRTTTVDELVPAVLGEWLTFETFCSGIGGRWAERRLTIDGEQGARYEVATLWVCVDAATGRPHRLTEQFERLYGEAAGDRRISARQINPGLPAADERDPARPWQVRLADLDVYGHANNAAYWAVVEQWSEPWSGPRRVRIEYGAGVTEVERVDIAVAPVGAGRGLWWLPPPGPDGAERSESMASAIVEPLPPDLYA